MPKSQYILISQEDCFNSVLDISPPPHALGPRGLTPIDRLNRTLLPSAVLVGDWIVGRDTSLGDYAQGSLTKGCSCSHCVSPKRATASAIKCLL